MCGFAGIFGSRPVDQGVLAAMADSLAHRGPDDRGTWRDDAAGIGLAHRRLSIVDLSAAGHQPMLSRSGRWVLAYNGEVYNHAAIRAELVASGGAPAGAWRGHSDTETLLAAVEAWGLRATLERAEGMFALALWDRREECLLLARDRFGEKPLYYGWSQGAVVFGSELKALRCQPGFDAAVDPRALRFMLSRNNVPAPWSIYRGIFKLEPGCIATIGRPALAGVPDEPPAAPYDRGGLSIERYWSMTELAECGAADRLTDEAAATDAVETALDRALAGQCMADVPLGAFLSGGIDSSVIVALMRRHVSGKAQTFTIGFDAVGYDEAADARAVARHLGTDHHEHYVSAADALAVIPSLSTIYDEPFADSSQIPTYLVSRMARGSVTVALSGDGGDELFGGYNRHRWAPAIARRTARLPNGARRLAGAALGVLPPRPLDRVSAALGGPRQLGLKTRKVATLLRAGGGLQAAYAGTLDQWQSTRHPVRGLDAATRPALPAAGALDPAERLMLWDALGYLPDDILHKVDRAAMAVSLETRVPFLDRGVAEVAARLAPTLKLREGHGKWILRRLLDRYVPRHLIDRPKAGFAVPVDAWLGGPLRDWAEHLLSRDRLAAAGLIDPVPVHATWRAQLRGGDHGAALWPVLMFQAWREANGR